MNMRDFALPPLLAPPAGDAESVSNAQHAARSKADALDHEGARIIQGLRNAEPRAAELLYRRLAPAVSRTLWQLVRHSAAERDDLMQVTFERIISTLVNGSYRGTCGLNRWAVAIATHAAIDHHRARGREQQVLDLDSGDGAAMEGAPARDVERAIIARAELRDLESTLARMKPLDVQALLLCHALGHSVPEAASMMGTTEAATASRLARARRDLARRLRKRG
jgi:RNA polymerase sigma factor (sigma-70 family)